MAKAKNDKKTDQPEAPKRVVRVYRGRGIFEDVEIPTGTVTIGARVENRPLHGRMFTRTPDTLAVEELGWTDAQWADALADRLLVIVPVAEGASEDDEPEAAPELTSEEKAALTAGGFTDPAGPSSKPIPPDEPPPVENPKDVAEDDPAARNAR